jgi:ribonuclease MRP protein subunit SNM1
MASPDLSARLRYLNGSAHLLATTAPATSKYLMSKCNSLMFDNNVEQSESHKRKACGACGTIMILGWDGKLKLDSQRAQRGKSTPRRTTDRARAMVYKCESCGRETRLNMSSSAPKHKALSLSNAQDSSSVTQASNTSLLSGDPTPPQAKSNIPSTPSGSSSSKKRTKARKQGGLEAILARQRATDSRRSSGFGLDLLDFMKKS